MTNDQIIDSILNQVADDHDDEEEVENDQCQKMQIEEGLMLQEKYLEFLERQSCVSEQDLIVTYIIQKRLKLAQTENLKQATICQMFYKFKK